LKPGTTYHYRVVATNLYGTSAGADATFTTTSSGSWKAPAPLGSFTGLTLAKQRVRLTARGAAPIRVACPGGAAGRCAGTLTLTTKVKRTTLKKARHGRRKRVTVRAVVKLASARFTVVAGTRATVTVRLPRRWVARVARARGKRLVTTATAVAADAQRRRATTKAAVTLLAARRARGHANHPPRRRRAHRRA
jgi:hypothetical protein